MRFAPFRKLTNLTLQSLCEQDSFKVFRRRRLVLWILSSNIPLCDFETTISKKIIVEFALNEAKVPFHFSPDYGMPLDVATCSGDVQ